MSYAKGRHLFHQGDPVRGAFSLTSGVVAIERIDENGDSVILRLLLPGAFFPCADLFADGSHGTSARAMTEVAACFIAVDRLDLALADPGLRAQVMRRACAEARSDEDTIFRLCTGDLSERVFAIIQALAEDLGRPDGQGGTVLTMPLSWRDVATMVGTSPEVMSRLLKRMGDSGRLAVSGREVRMATPTARRSQASS